MQLFGRDGNDKIDRDFDTHCVLLQYLVVGICHPFFCEDSFRDHKNQYSNKTTTTTTTTTTTNKQIIHCEYKQTDRMNSFYAYLAVSLLSSAFVEGYGGTFDAHQVCSGKHGAVIKSEADQNSDANGWLVYSHSLIVCCEGVPHDIMCSEMMVG